MGSKTRWKKWFSITLISRTMGSACRAKSPPSKKKKKEKEIEPNKGNTFYQIFNCTIAYSWCVILMRTPKALDSDIDPATVFKLVYVLFRFSCCYCWFFSPTEVLTAQKIQQPTSQKDRSSHQVQTTAKRHDLLM